VESPPASERSATDRSDNVRVSVCNGVRLDDQWKHQRLHKGTPRGRPSGAGKPSIQSCTVLASSSLAVIESLIQLGDATRGLIYIHGQEMIHGDLKGVGFFITKVALQYTLRRLPAKANILIDQTGHASLADFGLLTIVSDPTNLLSSSSYTQGGTLRWMSPERIAPQRFGFKDGRPTILSDCYALGMVIYETISGNLPFHKYADLVVFMKVVEGERPSRGDKFTRSLSWMLERCWAPNPNDRPNIEDVLLCLEMASSSPGPSSPMTDEGTDEDDEDDEDDDWGSPTGSSGGKSLAPDDRVEFPPIHFPQDLHLTDSRHTPPEVRPSVSSWATLERECS